MPHYDDMYGSRYLSAAELKETVNATIERVDFEQFTRPGEPPRTKAVIYVKGGKKGIVLNTTNARLLSGAFGKDFNWVGKRISIRSEPVIFAGKPTAGLRVYPAIVGSSRIESGTSAPVPTPPAPPSQNEIADEIPPW